MMEIKTFLVLYQLTFEEIVSLDPHFAIVETSGLLEEHLVECLKGPEKKSSLTKIIRIRQRFGITAV